IARAEHIPKTWMVIGLLSAKGSRINLLSFFDMSAILLFVVYFFQIRNILCNVFFNHRRYAVSGNCGSGEGIYFWVVFARIQWVIVSFCYRNTFKSFPAHYLFAFKVVHKITFFNICAKAGCFTFMVKKHSFYHHFLIEGNIAPNSIPKTFSAHWNYIEGFAILFTYKQGESSFVICIVLGMRFFLFNINQIRIFVFGNFIALNYQLLFNVFMKCGFHLGGWYKGYASSVFIVVHAHCIKNVLLFFKTFVFRNFSTQSLCNPS